jgi:hypothetical protein
VHRNSTIAAHGRQHTDDAVVEQPELMLPPTATLLDASLRRAVGQRHIKKFGQGGVTGTVTAF